MPTASSLNAASSIINGQGLGINPNLLSAITTFQNTATVKLVGNIFANANIAGNGYPMVIAQLNNLGNGVNKGLWLLDFYPANVTPVKSTGNIKYYGTVTRTASFSDTVKSQAQAPFASGMAGFANVFLNAYGYSQQVFSTVSSVNLLKSKKYSEMGIGYTGPADVVTGGLGSSGPILANVVANWGTMYDIRNISKFTDPYVFGQNLINQGLGYVNGLSDQFENAGLNTSMLPKIPASSSVTEQLDTTTTVPSFVGEVDIPVINEVTTTTLVTGSSPTVVLNILDTVTGSNLQAIVSATGITTTANASVLTTLKDYLNYEKVISSSLRSQLSTIGINNFTDLQNYLAKRIGQGNFRSWDNLSEFFASIDTPSLSYLPTGANANVLYSTTTSTINSIYGTGSGDLGNPVLNDYFGTAAGDPYFANFQTINSHYNTLVTATSVSSLVVNLNRAVYDYGVAYSAYDSDYWTSNGSPSLSEPSIVPITSNVTAINSALNSLSNTSAYYNSEVAYYTALNSLTREVNNLQQAGVVFGPAPSQTLKSFAENIATTAADKTETKTYQFFSNLITNDVYGDTIRAAIAETINTRVLNSVGITVFNDPDPRMKVYQSEAQNVPLSTYISRNK